MSSHLPTYTFILNTYGKIKVQVNLYLCLTKSHSTETCPLLSTSYSDSSEPLHMGLYNVRM